MRTLGVVLLLLFSIATVAQTATPDYKAAQDEAVKFLSDLIKIDTSDPPGNELKVDEYIKGILDKEGIASETIELTPGRGVLIARLKGNDSKKPILLMAHSDVVPVERDKWTFDPFGGEVKDGYVYGRGAIDDKAFLATNLEVLLQLHRLKVPLDRDVIFLTEASEEANSPYRMKSVADTYWEKFAPEFVLNEGGETSLANGKVNFVAVSTAEKVPRQFKLQATGTSGHGSVPRTDNPIVHLAAAVAKAGTWDTPSRMNDTTREFFKRLATISAPNEAALYRHVEDPLVQKKLRTLQPHYYSMLRTSVVPTVIKGGIKDNVIPATAEATLDVRALPDEDLAAFAKKLETLINDPLVKVVPQDWSTSMPATPPSKLDSEMFKVLEETQKKVFPGAITLPTMTTGATDSAFFRLRRVQSYGIGMPLEQGDRVRIHGNDERAPVASVGKFVEFVYTAVTGIAASK